MTRTAGVTPGRVCQWHCCQNARLPEGWYCADHAPIVEREKVITVDGKSIYAAQRGNAQKKG